MKPTHDNTPEQRPSLPLATSSAASVGDFNPPLAIGERFRSARAKPHHGYLVVERIESRGVVAVNHYPDGTRGGHVELFEFNRRGLDGGGYVRL
jgi:hypothetical protein